MSEYISLPQHVYKSDTLISIDNDFRTVTHYKFFNEGIHFLFIIFAAIMSSFSALLGSSLYANDENLVGPGVGRDLALSFCFVMLRKNDNLITTNWPLGRHLGRINDY